MNLRKGCFRLTLVLSILVGIILPFSMRERYPYTIYEVRREKGEGVEKLTVTFEWYGEDKPDLFNFNQMFHEAEKFKSTNTGEKVDLREKQKKGSIIIDPLGLLTDKEKLPTYTILKKTVNPIKWNKFFYKMAIGFTSIWLIYAFIRWVMVFFVIGGFKSKTTQ